jgi:hypothetical protein
VYAKGLVSVIEDDGQKVVLVFQKGVSAIVEAKWMSFAMAARGLTSIDIYCRAVGNSVCPLLLWALRHPHARVEGGPERKYTIHISVMEEKNRVES